MQSEWVRIYRKAGKRCQYAKAKQVTERTVLECNRDSLGKTLNGYISRRVLDSGDWLINNWKFTYGCSAQAFKELGWCFSFEEATGCPRNSKSASSRRERLAKK